MEPFGDVGNILPQQLLSWIVIIKTCILNVIVKIQFEDENLSLILLLSK